MTISRMQFLRGDFSGKEAPLRPPWAIAESLFTEICTGCGDCISHCPTHIIQLARANFPVINFSFGECLFCEQCVDACQSHALLKNTQDAVWNVKASINDKACLTYQGVTCRSCFDPCEARAIQMPPQLGGISTPVLNPNICTGCGACFSVCPVQAISMNERQEAKVKQ